MRLGELFDATVGRRLLVRIWMHGLLLFAGVLVTVIVARGMMTDMDEAHVLRARPYLALAVADRALELRGDRAALAQEVVRAAAGAPLELAVMDGDGRVLADSATRAPPVLPADLRRALATAPDGARWWHRRLYVARFTGDHLDAWAMVSLPAPPSVPWHAAMLLTAALILGFLFVAAPLTRSIARPIERLGALARELGAGNLAVRAGSRRRDEIGDLARSFDTMAGQIQHLRTAERELLGDVSHELRTPLARMQVVLELAAGEGVDGERMRRYLGEITTDLGELACLVDDIIVASQLDPEAARWDEARPPLRRVPLAAAALVEAAASRFGARWPERTLAVEGDAGARHVDGDPALLRRVLDNLLDNARKYSPADAPVVLRVAADGAGVRFEVEDRGVGIAAADHPRVFSAFFRADRSRARGSGGVGLGLALARRIVLAHGGTIGFDSTPDRGSRFWLRLDAVSDT